MLKNLISRICLIALIVVSLQTVIPQTGARNTSSTDAWDVQKLNAVLNDENISRFSSERINALIEIAKLAQQGKIHSLESIRTIAANIDVDVNSRSTGIRDSNGIEIVVTSHTHLDPAEKTFPGVSALIAIGDDSLPAVLDLILENDTNSLRSANAIYVLTQHFRDTPEKARTFLRSALQNTEAATGKARLSAALTEMEGH